MNKPGATSPSTAGAPEASVPLRKPEARRRGTRAPRGLHSPTPNAAEVSRDASRQADTVSTDWRAYTAFRAFVHRHIVQHGLSHAAFGRWATEAELALGGQPIASVVEHDGDLSTAVAERDGSLVVCEVSPNSICCEVHATTRESAEARLAELREQLPAAPTLRDDRIVVAFWRNGPHQPAPIRRRVAVPRWSEIERNYHAATRRRLDALMRLTPSVDAGKLVLWHGPPGTGKTWALRALSREWAAWATTHYITDPEQFFGPNVDYMLRIVLETDDDETDNDDDNDADQQGTASRWRLLVMEDTGELLAMDARREAGQGLSRLLNVCDGLIGQGLQLIVLITTNEDLGVMHPAVIRRGRSLANIRFDPLTGAEAAAWAGEHELLTSVDGGVLADLFGGDDEHTPPTPRRLIGFRPPILDPPQSRMRAYGATQGRLE